MDDYGTIEQRRQQTEEFRNKLNSISSSFCVAKWKQVTLHLATGQTHSCHHPGTHHIPLEEIAIDVSALHNTKFKKDQQQKMLNGIKPAECDYCWRIEDSDPNGTVFSDRIMKSMEKWAQPHIDSIVNSSPTNSINPSYLEVSFSNVCNFKCSYCNPESSSKWLEEINNYGPYPTSNKFNNLQWIRQQNKYPILEKEDNPYVNAFWKWWPDLYPSLQVLRVTGGEPLLTKHTFTLLEYVLANPHPDLELNINSNLCVPPNLINKFIELINRIQDAGAIKSFKLYTSCEAKGAKAEYIRYGLNYNQWLDNCNQILEKIPNANLTVMSTYNALSVTSYKDFLADILKLKVNFSNNINRNPIGVDIPYLRWPAHQAINILPNDYLPLIEEQVTYMYQNMQQIHWEPLCGKGFYDYEINRMTRVYKVFSSELDNTQNIVQHRKDFVAFVDEHDIRRGTNFLKTFPEMEEFYRKCKE